MVELKDLLDVSPDENSIRQHFAGLGITSEGEIRRALSHAIRMADKRYKKILKTGGSPAADMLESSTASSEPLDWHVKGKSTSEVIDVFRRAQEFSSLSTSNAKSAEAFRKGMLDVGKQSTFAHLTIPKQKAYVLKHFAALGITDKDELEASFAFAIRQVDKEYKKVLAVGGSPATERLKEKSYYSDNPFDYSLRKSFEELPWLSVPKTKEDLLTAYLRAQRFSALKTSTLEGREEWKNNVIEGLQAKQGITVTDEQFNRLFKAYSEYTDLHPDAKEYIEKYQVFDRITQVMIADKNVDVDTIINTLQAENQKAAREAELEDARELQEIEKATAIEGEDFDADWYDY